MLRRLVLSLVTLSLAACERSAPTAAEVEPSLARPAPGTGYTLTILGGLPGDDHSRAFGVNGGGIAVGISQRVGNPGTAVAWTAAGIEQLGATGASSFASDVSDGPTPYVVGWERVGSNPTQAIRWTLSTPRLREILGTGLAHAVNDAGVAAGSSGASVALWRAPAVVELVVDPAAYGYSTGTAWAINDSEHLAVELQRNVDGRFAAFLRRPDGTLVPLPLVDACVSARAYDISEVVSGVVYLAGLCEDGAGASRAVRWSVVDATGAVTALDLGAGAATGVNDRGEVAGTRVRRKRGGRTGFLWDGTQFLTLKPASGDVIVDGSSGGTASPRYVSGADDVKGAVLYTVP